MITQQPLRRKAQFGGWCLREMEEQTSRRGGADSADLADVPSGLGGDDIPDANVLDVEAPAVEEDEVDEGYVLEDEDEDLEKEEQEDEGLGPLGGGDEDF